MGCVNSTKHASEATELEEVAFILLGNQSVGKTTVLRHLQLSYGQFNDLSQRQELSQLIKNSILAHLTDLCLRVHSTDVCNSYSKGTERPQIPVSEHLVQLFNELNIIIKSSGVTPEAIKLLETICEAKTSPFIDSPDMQFLCDVARRSLNPSYAPTDIDILRVQWPSVGVSNAYIDRPRTGHRLRIIDVGGRKAERRKWKQAYQNSNAKILYVAALDSFCTRTSNASNAMKDSIDQLAELCLSPSLERPDKGLEGKARHPSSDGRHWTTGSGSKSYSISMSSLAEYNRDREIILILNKRDLFERKLKEHPELFYAAFPDFPRAPPEQDINVDAALQTVRQAFAAECAGRRIEVVVMSAFDLEHHPLNALIEPSASRHPTHPDPVANPPQQAMVAV